MIKAPQDSTLPVWQVPNCVRSCRIWVVIHEKQSDRRRYRPGERKLIMAIFPGAVKVHCANNGAWIGAMDFLQVWFPSYGSFCAGLLSSNKERFLPALHP